MLHGLQQMLHSVMHIRALLFLVSSVWYGITIPYIHVFDSSNRLVLLGTVTSIIIVVKINGIPMDFRIYH